MSHRPGTAQTDVEKFFKAINQGKIRSITEYLDGGIDVNAVDGQCQTPLIRAIYLNKEDVRSHVVRMLLRNGADVNVQDRQGKTALMHACAECGHDDVIRRIIGTGKCNPNIQDCHGNCALGYAVKAQNSSAIRILVNSAYTKSVMDVTLANDDDDDPLSMALKLGHQQCAKVLVEEGNADCGMDTHGLISGREGNSKDHDNTRRKNSTNSTSASSKTSLKIERISIHSKGGNISLEDEPAITPVDVGDQ